MIGELEDAIIQRLQTAFAYTTNVDWQYKVPTIESFGGQISVDESGRAVAMAVFSMPAIFVTFGGLRREQGLGEKASRMNQKMVVYVVTQNSRNERAQRLGDLNSVGSYQLAEDVAQLLANQRFGMQIEGMRLEEIETVFNAHRADAKAISVLAVNLSTKFTFLANKSDCELIPGDTALRGEATEQAGYLATIADRFFLPPSTQSVMESTVSIPQG